VLREREGFTAFAKNEIGPWQKVFKLVLLAILGLISSIVGHFWKFLKEIEEGFKGETFGGKNFGLKTRLLCEFHLENHGIYAKN